jgi:hypothetical protein
MPTYRRCPPPLRPSKVCSGNLHRKSSLAPSLCTYVVRYRLGYRAGSKSSSKFPVSTHPQSKTPSFSKAVQYLSRTVQYRTTGLLQCSRAVWTYWYPMQKTSPLRALHAFFRRRKTDFPSYCRDLNFRAEMGCGSNYPVRCRFGRTSSHAASCGSNGCCRSPLQVHILSWWVAFV